MSVLTPTTPGGAAMMALTKREVVRFLRQPTRLAASIGTAAIVWVLAGSGFSKSFAMPAVGADAATNTIAYTAFLLPGMAAMIVVFSAIFAAITLIQDRQAGFLQSALVSPAPTWAIVGSKVLGGTIVATLQASVLLIAAPLAGVKLGFGLPLAFLAAALTSAAIISLGLACAWRINSIAGFHGVMNLLLLPMWVLSGSLFPVRGAAPWLQHAVELNPLHWSVNCIGWAMGVGGVFNLLQWIGIAAFAAAMFGLAWLAMRGRTAPASSEGEA